MTGAAMDLLPLESFLFDLDGTLIDSNGAHAAAFQEALAEVAPDLLPRFEYSQFRGWSTADVCRALGIVEPARTIERKQSAYWRRLSNAEVPFFPFAIELLRLLNALGKRLYLVTSASPQSAEAILGRGGVLPLFSGIVHYGESVRSKPAPDLYLRCLTKYRIAPQTAVAIEDSPSGVASAAGAGLRTIAVQGDIAGATCSLATIGELYKLVESAVAMV